MRLPVPFRPQCEHIAIDLPGGRALFTTRRGGSSEGPYASLNLGLFTNDDPARVSKNRERLAALTGTARDRFLQGRQVHEATVQRWQDTSPVSASQPAEADGQATSLRDAAAVVLVADCLPVALATPGAVAMVHAGWRGLVGGVIEAGMAAVRELGGRGSLEAAIGPGAGPCCYEVGDEVRAVFAGQPEATPVDGHLDLKAAARARLLAAGASRVHDVGLCTMCCDPTLFFSHRRDGGVTGRQAGVAWRRP